MAIERSYAANLETLYRAFANGDAALVETTMRDTGERAIVLAAIGYDGNEYVITPFARMFDDNPYELLNPPADDTEE